MEMNVSRYRAYFSRRDSGFLFLYKNGIFASKMVVLYHLVWAK